MKVYQRNGLSLNYLETLTAGLSSPSGTFATPSGFWYVANAGHSNVLIYRTTNRGPRGPLATLDDYQEVPVNVAVTPNRRLVAVSNGTSTSGGRGSLSVYRDRNAEPKRILTYGSGPVVGMGVAIDRLGNCFWSFNDPTSSSGSIVEFSGCRGRGALVVSGIAKAGGIAFDQHDNLYYVDQASGIYKCSGSSNCGLFATGFGLPTNVNFDHKRKHLWVADATGYIDAVDPQTGAIQYTVEANDGPSDPPFGIAPSPGG